MIEYGFSKRTLADGWVQVTIVSFRPMNTPDFALSGDSARLEIARFILAGAAGFANVWAPAIEASLNQLFRHIESVFWRQHPEIAQRSIERSEMDQTETDSGDAETPKTGH